MKKRALIVKNPKAKVVFRETALEVVSPEERLLIGFRHITGLFVHKNVRMSIGEALKISKHIPVILIDKRGYLLGEIKCAM